MSSADYRAQFGNVRLVVRNPEAAAQTATTKYRQKGRCICHHCKAVFWRKRRVRKRKYCTPACYKTACRDIVTKHAETWAWLSLLPRVWDNAIVQFDADQTTSLTSGTRKILFASPHSARFDFDVFLPMRCLWAVLVLTRNDVSKTCSALSHYPISATWHLSLWKGAREWLNPVSRSTSSSTAA